MDELWEILNSSFGEEKEGEAVVAVLEEVGVEGKKDSNHCPFSMGILGSHRKVPIRWLQGGFLRPFGAFLERK
jgi:hypothetical protein